MIMTCCLVHDVINLLYYVIWLLVVLIENWHFSTSSGKGFIISLTIIAMIVISSLAISNLRIHRKCHLGNVSVSKWF